jgi:hypothetical protein
MCYGSEEFLIKICEPFQYFILAPFVQRVELGPANVPICELQSGYYPSAERKTYTLYSAALHIRKSMLQRRVDIYSLEISNSVTTTSCSISKDISFVTSSLGAFDFPVDSKNLIGARSFYLPILVFMTSHL